jgi:hypothetical protein
VLAEILRRGSTTLRTLAEYRALELGLDVGSILGAGPSQVPAIETLGKRLKERARDLVAPDLRPLTAEPAGVNRAQA